MRPSTERGRDDDAQSSNSDKCLISDRGRGDDDDDNSDKKAECIGKVEAAEVP